jgi:hypothetical protein
VIVWVPTERLAVLNEAEPALSIAVPICVCPSRKAIEPVGTPIPDCGATLTVNVTFCPLVNWVAEADREASAAIFAGAKTVTETTADVDAEKFKSPE